MRGLLIGALLTTACGATVSATDSHGDAAADAPATPTRCSRWSPGDEAVIVSDPADQERFRLVDAIATPDGALVAWRERDPSGRDDDQVHVRRLHDDGSVHPWSAPGRGSRRDVVTLPRAAELQFSMVWDAARDGVAMLAGGRTDRGACVFARFLGDDSQAWQDVDLTGLGGFALAGCGSLARTSDGWSFLTSEVRALWGDELVFLSDEGRLAGTPARLPMTSAPTDSPMTRTDLPDGFVATWVQATAMSPRTDRELHVRRFDPRGTPRGDDETISINADGYAFPRVLDTRDGLLATWFGGVVSARPLHADGSAAGDTVALNGDGIHADVRGDDVVVVTSVPAEPGMARLYFIVTDLRGVQRGSFRWVLPNRPLTPIRGMRIVPTRRGALIVFGQGERILAVPVGCAP